MAISFGFQGMKYCKGCQSLRDPTQFNIDRTSKDGLRSRCTDCVGKSLDPDYDLMNMYGLTRKDYEVMCQAQDNYCTICQQEKKLYVDHDHTTEVIRGLLCNTVI